MGSWNGQVKIRRPFGDICSEEDVGHWSIRSGPVACELCRVGACVHFLAIHICFVLLVLSCEAGMHKRECKGRLVVEKIATIRDFGVAGL